MARIDLPDWKVQRKDGRTTHCGGWINLAPGYVNIDYSFPFPGHWWVRICAGYIPSMRARRSWRMHGRISQHIWTLGPMAFSVMWMPVQRSEHGT